MCERAHLTHHANHSFEKGLPVMIRRRLPGSWEPDCRPGRGHPDRQRFPWKALCEMRSPQLAANEGQDYNSLDAYPQALCAEVAHLVSVIVKSDER